MTKYRIVEVTDGKHSSFYPQEYIKWKLFFWDLSFWKYFTIVDGSDLDGWPLYGYAKFDSLEDANEFLDNLNGSNYIYHNYIGNR